MKIIKQLHSIFLFTVLAVLAVNPAIAERTTTYFHSDRAGSIVAASDQNGDLLWRKQYQPFGTQIEGSNISESTSFTGKQHDDTTGLTYFGARYYDPMLGRFVSTDPVSPLAGAGISPYLFNRYAYANNNPYRYIDPDGRIVQIIGPILFGLGILLESGDANAPSEENQTSPKPQPDPTVLIPGAKQAKTANAAKNTVKSQVKEKTEDATSNGSQKIYRMGTSKESKTRLGKKSQEAEDVMGRHGVSGSTNKPKAPCSSASCSDLEDAGFKVTPTPSKRDSGHVTIELPKPVTKETADKFNKAFGRD